MNCSPRGGLLIRTGFDSNTDKAKKEQNGNIS